MSGRLVDLSDLRSELESDTRLCNALGCDLLPTEALDRIVAIVAGFPAGVDADRRASSLRDIALRIAAGLFTNGQNERAGRLVLEPKGERLAGYSLGGWSEAGATDAIVRALTPATPHDSAVKP